MNIVSSSIVICAEQPSQRFFSSGLEKSPKCIRGCFKLSAVNQPLASLSNVPARISDIASGAMMFVVMIFVQGDLGRPQLLAQYSFLHCHRVLTTLIPC